MEGENSKSKVRKAKDFGFDLMEYEDSGNIHSTNLIWKVSDEDCSHLKLQDLILASRVASNSNKSLTIQSETKKARVNYLKKF
jgi:tRNA splicing endonuclease